MSSPSRYVLLDRDGTINVDKDYLSDPDLLELIPSAAEGLRELQELGFGLIVVTNQSGINRGYFSEQQLTRVHERLWQMLTEAGVTLQAIYHCPHGPYDGCRCRKPLPGLVEMAVADWHFDPRESFVVGDKASDISLGRRVGATTILVRTGYGAISEQDHACQANFVVDDLSSAAKTIANLYAVPPL